ncbi:Fur family transcriptional regulator [Butyrivibrio sp. YAB3001]|uniref:Fur family transcriptional regulator n=1 Tax=Butyrivibrio sp. YAB3001 TaxID=1520812 RepID=UPI0008F67DBB|nr:transcriptional repressor [Butyrivibrio sp. YAB3001]SFC84049.1 Fur family transcriptional regulator, ferric uptake regulator [Butyrivibrio sp. YAB3001]
MNQKIHPESYDDIIERNWPEGIKKTHQRIDIFKILYKEDLPISAADIYDTLIKEHPSEKYAFSTIYRNLIAFEKAGVVTKTVSSTEENALYELKSGKHRHFIICLKCHKRIPIKTCPLHDIMHDIEDTVPGFEVTGHSLEIYGYCNDCKSE